MGLSIPSVWCASGASRATVQFLFRSRFPSPSRPAAGFSWGWGFHWTDLGLLLGMYVLTALGITVGFHRLFVHRSFETYTWVKFIWAVLGSMAVQGSLFRWVEMHRRHHQHSDTPEDPPSPQHGGKGVLDLVR